MDLIIRKKYTFAKNYQMKSKKKNDVNISIEKYGTFVVVFVVVVVVIVVCQMIWRTVVNVLQGTG